MAGKKQALQTIEETVPCERCSLSAKVKIRTDRWKNLCMGCYYKHHFHQSVDYCNAMGLTTTEQRIAWLKTHAKGITQRYTRNIPATREPGEDWEEDAA